MASSERYRSGMSQDGGGYEAYSAGDKRYGGGRSAPNVGPVRDKLGYAKRDRETKAKRNLALKRMQQDQGRKFEIM